MKDAILNICLKRTIIDEFAKKVPGKKKIINRYKTKGKPPTICNFQNYETNPFFARGIYEGIIALRETDHHQSNLLGELEKFITKTYPRKGEKIKKRSSKRACWKISLEENRF